ncbi:AAA family ATPase [Patescibacteria group bacterium]|nr:AAA family ATPase [Patescibacteria group bacterium]MBU1922578.1 AAA family ATPase [Patescibacteria group bacterium]
MDKQGIINLTICNRCGGTGLEQRNPCRLCQGMGFGLNTPLGFLYWGKNIDAFEILFRKWRKVFNNVLNFILLILFVLGIAALAWNFYNLGWLAMAKSSAWLSSNIFMFYFWLGLVLFSFLIYRLVLESEQRRKIILRDYEREEIDLATTPQINFEQVGKLPRAQKIDITGSYNFAAWQALERAYEMAERLKNSQVLSLHIFASLMSTSQIALLFSRLGVDMGKLKQALSNRLAKEVKSPSAALEWSDPTKLIMLGAYVDAYNHRHRLVGPIELFSKTVQVDEALQELMFGLEVDADELDNAISWIRMQEVLVERWREFRARARLKPRGAMNRAMTAIATPLLDRYGTDLTLMATYGHLAPCINRADEINQTLRIIEGGGQSVILVGEAGVGKGAIIEGLAQRMAEEAVPKILQDKRLVSLSLAQLISGASASDAQQRLLMVLREVGVSRNIVLVVPNVDKMVGITSGSEESIDLSEVFANELAKGYFTCIATARPRDYSRAVENRSLGTSLQKVEVKEMDENTAIRALQSKVGGIEFQNKVFFTYDALARAVRLSAKLMHERFLPAKAIEIIRETALEVRKTKGEKSLVGAEDVAKIITQKTKVPVTAVTQEESEKLLNLEKEIHQRVIGQDEAVKAVSAALRRARAELREKKRPIANFLFLGPTGVGKTELSKTVAQVYFGNEENMIRLDMSEYQEKTSIYRLVGVSGDKQGGMLTETVRKNPFAIVLLDEIEKAHPDILNVFLQVMDDGRLTDNLGRTIDFTNVILVCTSNAGTDIIQEELKKGTSVSEIQQILVQEKLKNYFRPEFLNRFDGIIVFKPLSAEEILQIAWLQLSRLQDNLEEKGIHLRVTEEAATELAKAGFDPLYGARPLKRVIQERVNDALANFLLIGKISRRDIVYLEPGGKIRVEKAKEL